MTTEFKTYKAVTGANGPIVSVYATTLTEAIEEIEHQLGRRGREGPYAQ